MQGNLSIERMCQLAGVSRASFYRSLAERQPVHARAFPSRYDHSRTTQCIAHAGEGLCLGTRIALWRNRDENA